MMFGFTAAESLKVDTMRPLDAGGPAAWQDYFARANAGAAWSATYVPKKGGEEAEAEAAAGRAAAAAALAVVALPLALGAALVLGR
jgi:hypothetical protein